MWKYIWIVLCAFFAAAAVAQETETAEKILFEDVTINAVAGDTDCSFVWEFSINNRQEEAVVKLFPGGAAMTEPPRISCTAPGFWSRRPEAEIIMEGNSPALRIKGKGRVNAAVTFAVRAEVSGSRRSLVLEFPEAAGSVSGTVSGADGRIVNTEIKNSVRNGKEGSFAWDLGRMELSWQVLEAEAETQAAGIQRIQGTVDVYAATDGLVMDMNASANVTAGEITFADWKIPAGWRPVKVVSSAPLRDWTFSAETNTMHLDFAAPVAGEYTVKAEFAGYLAELPGEFTAASPDPGTGSFNTRWTFAAAPGLVLECLDPGSLVRTADPAAEPRPLEQGSSEKQFYAGYGTGEPARFRLSVTEPRISHESFIRITLGAERFTAKGDFKVNIAESPVDELKIISAKDWVFQELITGSGERVDVSAAPYPADPGMQYWILKLPRKVIGEWEFTMLWEKTALLNGEFASGWFSVEDSGGRGHAALICDPAVLPGEISTIGVTPVPADALPVRSSRTVAAGIVRNEPWQIYAKPVPAPKKVSGEIFDLYVAEEGRNRGMSLFTLNCTGAPFEEMIFQFPAECGNIEFTASGNVKISGISDAGGAPEGFIRKRLSFGSRVSGAVTLLASFELPGGTEVPFAVGGIGVPGGEITAVFAAVTGSPVMKIRQEETGEGITPILHEELPAEYSALAGGRILQAWRFTGDAPGKVRVISGGRVEALPAVIEYADYSCRLSAAGECVLEAAYIVKNSSAQYLRFKLPAGAEIWDLAVNGKYVQPYSDGNFTLAALPLPESPLDMISVTLTAAYSADFAPGGAAVLPLPETDIRIIRRRVSVRLPETAAAPEADKSSFVPGLSAWFSPALTPLLEKLFLVGILAAGAFIAALSAGIAFGCRRMAAAVAGAAVFAGCVLGGISEIAGMISEGTDAPAPAPVQEAVYETLADFGEAENFVIVEMAGQKNSGIFMWIYFAAGAAAAAAGAFLIRRRSFAGSILMGAGAVSLLAGASMTIEGTVWAWTVVALAVLLLLPLLAGIGVCRWKRGAVLCALIFCAAGASAADGGQIQIKSSAAEMTLLEDSLKSTWVYELEAETGDSITISGASAMVFPGNLPGGLLLSRNGEGEWFLAAADDFEGSIALEQIVPLKRKGNERTALLTLPAAVRNTLSWKEAPESPEIKIGGAVRIDGTSALMPAGGGDFLITVPDTPSAAAAAKPEAAVTEKILFAPGAVHRYTSCRYRSARSGVGEVKIRPGEGWQTVDVRAENIDRWTSAPDGTVTIYFLTPVKGEFTCFVESIRVLPAEGDDICTVIPAALPGAAERGGILEFAAASGRRFTVTETSGTVKIAGEDGSVRFRYTSSDGVSCTVENSAEKPGLRADTAVHLAVEEDRMSLKCDYLFEAVSGEIFEQRIKIPAGFEVISVTASEPVEWRSSDGYITVAFRNVFRSRACTVHCSFVSPGAPAALISVPDPAPVELLRRTGTVTVTAARGNTLSVSAREGVSSPEVSADGRLINCRILDGNWRLEASCSAAKPWISAEQRTVVHLKPAAAEITCTSDILVENNSVRSLLVKMPSGITGYEFEGRGIARVSEAGEGLVRIDFTGRTEGEYRLVCRMTLPAGDEFTVTPLGFPEAAGTVAGKLAVTVSGCELLPSEAGGSGISPMGQREFGMLDGNAGLPLEAWHTSGSQWQLRSGILRNSGVATSRITLENMNISSVIADNGMEIARLQADVSCNGGGFLIFRLPANSTLLAAGFNGMPSVPVYENGDMMLAADEGRSRFFLEYAVRHSAPLPGQETAFAAPGFNAPVSGISWYIAGCRGMDGSFVSGTLEPASITGALLLREEPVPPRIPYGDPGQMSQVQLQAMNANFEKQMLYSSSPGAKSDIYGQMLELNAASNAFNLSSRRRKLAGGVTVEAEPDVDMVAEKIFSSQYSMQQAAPALRAVLPEGETPLLQLEGAMLTVPFAPVEAVVSWHGAPETARPAAGGILIVGAGALLAMLLWFACRKRGQYDA